MNQAVFDEFARVLEPKYKGPVLNYKQTHPHLIQKATIYNDVKYVSVEAKNYSLRSREDYMFVVEKLKAFKRKLKKVTLTKNILNKIDNLKKNNKKN